MVYNVFKSIAEVQASDHVQQFVIMKFVYCIILSVEIKLKSTFTNYHGLSEHTRLTMHCESVDYDVSESMSR